MKIQLLILFFVAVGSRLYAQDLIYKTNSEVIECKVTKIDANSIYYTQPKYKSVTEFKIDKSLVFKVVYESGEELILPTTHAQDNKVGLPKKGEKDYRLQKKNILKFQFFSPLAGALAFGYEHSLGLQRSIEMSVGFIGIGSNYYESARGAYARFGYKLIRDPDIYERLGSGGHVLKGFYVRPDIIVSYFTYSEYSYYTSSGVNKSIQVDAFSVAFLVSAGKQWIFNDAFSVSWSVGLGYAFSSQEGYYYSHLTGGNEFPIAASVTLSVGLLH